MLENTEGAIENGQSKETGKIGYTRRKQKAKQKTPCLFVLVLTVLYFLSLYYLFLYNRTVL
jgi:hypothetical protein